MSFVEWRPVVGFEGLYEVSSTGRVRSLDREVPHWTGVKTLRRGREMKRTPFGAYLRVTLSRDGSYRSVAVHTIVAAAFHGRQAVDFAAPDYDTDPDQRETELTFERMPAGKFVDGEDRPAGLYCWYTDYPDEGCMLLDEEPSGEPSATPLL